MEPSCQPHINYSCLDIDRDYQHQTSHPTTPKTPTKTYTTIDNDLMRNQPSNPDLAANLQLESSAQEIFDTTFEHVDSVALEECPDIESTSIALHLCKRRVLKPYFRVLSMLGWRPIISPYTDDIKWYGRFFNWFYTLFITCFILSGYLLQYASCFRQDGYPPYKDPNRLIDSIGLPGINHTHFNFNITDLNNITNDFLNLNHVNSHEHPSHLRKCSGNFISLYLIPDILHLFAYLFVLQLMRTPECERLQNLLERVFLEATKFTGWPGAQKQIVRTLRLFLWLCLAWVTLSVFAHIIHIITFKEICFTWMHPNSKLLTKIMTGITVLSLTWNDIICAAIVINYSLHCHLNISYLCNLCSTIRERSIDIQEVCKKVEEARKFIDYLNKDQALGVSLLLINFGCRAVVALFGLISQQVDVAVDVKTSIVVLTSAFLWISLLSFPVFQAARLTEKCNDLKNIGHELSARPFGYQNTSQDDLNSLLLFLCSIKMEAKILHIPIRPSWLISLLILALFTILFFGQIGYIKF